MYYFLPIVSTFNEKLDYLPDVEYPVFAVPLWVLYFVVCIKRTLKA
jgi:hypothetical protein